MIFLRAEGAPHRGIDAEYLEEIPGDARGRNLLGIALAGDVECLVAIGGKPGKGMGVFGDELKARICQRAAAWLARFLEERRVRSYEDTPEERMVEMLKRS